MAEKVRYKIVSRIAAGGMAEVYLGESAGIEGFRKKVAIKKVLPKLSANTEFLNMFLDEARLCAYLTHSKCVQVFDIGEAAGAHFIVMEFVDGADLKAVIEHLSAQQQVLPVEVACYIALHVCEGLSYAHGAKDHNGHPLEIVHRDISPHNVLMTRTGEVKLVDFGLARASSHLTKEDEDIVKGKFGYLAPEVTTGQGADKRVDIFAVGILLWEMLAGRRLFHGSSDLETFKLVQKAEIPDLRPVRSDVNDDVHYVLTKALARDREQRYQTADEMAHDLGLVLARLQRPVSYLDVGRFVTAAADERAKKRKPVAADALLGDLIIDALHEFSLDDEELPLEEQSRLGTRGVIADNEAGFEDPSAWGLGDELGDLFDEKKEPEVIEAVDIEEGGGAAPPPRRAPPPRTAAQRARMNSMVAPESQQAPAAGEEGDENGPWWRRWF